MVIATDTARGPTATRWALGFIAVTYGIIVSSRVSWRGDVAPWRRRMALGAGAGLVAALTVVLATMIRATIQGRASAVPALAIAFELVSGVVCGAVAAPTAMRLLTRRPP